MVVEEVREVGPAVFVEMADVECECAHREEEDHDENIGKRRREIRHEFALEDGPQGIHARASRARVVSSVVMARDTSSRRTAAAQCPLTSHASTTESALKYSI